MLDPTSQYPYKLKKSKSRYGDYPFELITRYSLEQCIRRLQIKHRLPVPTTDGWYTESSVNVIRINRFHDDVAEFSIDFKGQPFVKIQGMLERLNNGTTSVRGYFVNRNKAPQWLYALECLLFASTFLFGFTAFLMPNALSILGTAILIVPTGICILARMTFNFSSDITCKFRNTYIKYIKSIFEYR